MVKLYISLSINYKIIDKFIKYRESYSILLNTNITDAHAHTHPHT